MGHQVSSRIVVENRAQKARTQRILKVADPTIVPIPTLFCAMNTPITEVKNSGADPPAAMNVAPATSSLMSSFSVITPNDGTKNSSHTIARATNMYTNPNMWSNTAPR